MGVSNFSVGGLAFGPKLKLEGEFFEGKVLRRGAIACCISSSAVVVFHGGDRLSSLRGVVVWCEVGQKLRYAGVLQQDTKKQY